MFKKFLSVFMVVVLVIQSGAIVLAQEVDQDGIVLYLVRHGQTEFNATSKVQGWADSPLTESGIQIVENTGMGLADVKFEKAFSSDRGRASQTAEIILGLNNNSSDIRLNRLSDLRETNYGKYEGETSASMWGAGMKKIGISSFEEIKSTKEIMDAISSTDETGVCENYDELSTRLMRGVYQVTTSVKEGNVLVVAHGNAIGIILNEISPTPISEIKNASVTKVKYSNGEFTILSSNDMSYENAGKLVRESNDGVALLPETNKPKTEKLTPDKNDKLELYVLSSAETIFDKDNRVMGQSDIPLTKDGIKYTIQSALGLKDTKFDYVYVSDLGRAIETANIIVSLNDVTEPNIKFNELKSLRDLDYGKFEGDIKLNMYKELLNKDSISNEEEFKTLIQNGKKIDSTFEDIDQLSERMVKSLDQIVNEVSVSGGGKVLIVSHSKAIESMLRKIDNPLITIKDGNISVINYEDGKYKVVKANDDSYAKNSKKLFAEVSDFKFKDEKQFLLENKSSNIAIKGDFVNYQNQDYYPVREVLEALGGKVYWDNTTKQVIAVSNGTKVCFDINSNVYTINNGYAFMDGFMVNLDGKSYAPISYILSTLGYSYDLSEDGAVISIKN